MGAVQAAIRTPLWCSLKARNLRRPQLGQPRLGGRVAEFYAVKAYPIKEDKQRRQCLHSSCIAAEVNMVSSQETMEMNGSVRILMSQISYRHIQGLIWGGANLTSGISLLKL